MRRGLGGTVAAFLVAALGGCGSGGGGGGGGGSGTFTATIDGQAFSATLQAKATASSRTAGQYILTGTQGSGASTESIGLTLYNIGATGTYPLGVGLTTFGGTGLVTEGTTEWTTPLDGTGGTVTIGTLTSTRIAGTFAFVASQLAGGASTVTVTAGNFDLPITGTPLTVPANQGSSVSATLGGTPWVGATIAIVSRTNGTFGFGATSTGTFGLTFGLTGVTGPGTYPFSIATSTGIVAMNGGQGWSYDTVGASGSFVVTTLNANRLMATFSGTLGSTGTGAPLTITNGMLDLGL